MKQSDYIERSNRRMAAIFAVIFLLICYKCSSQSRYYPTPMKFACGIKDTIYVSIESDSTLINLHLTVSCSKHEHLEWKSITLGFVDGEVMDMYQADGWNIYDVDRLRYIKFDYISFNEAYLSTECLSIKTKDYFIDFFR